ncbi:radical SAM family heme chaperone HemW [Chitinispirillales bacterium ANBcel5]|uniref:radical SAM family heme chaperone HemW n=1 Tax=Cellulosispirillum alkaliphilum TaxID=3039283 RepID=UPI002A52F852|nr:radical SAM family heme chaperone HemW [Chitinispirillales bacterium ANBcel5]
MNCYTNTLSLYIHIPFCLKKCRYCDFYSVPFNTELAQRYTSALVREWELIKKTLPSEPKITTIFMGGGTPSLLGKNDWIFLKERLFSKLDLSSLKEWTVEVNPETFCEEKAYLWAENGVNRLTFGVQSLNERELSICGRTHSAKKASEVLNNCTLNIFKSIGVDVIFGLPGQGIDSLKDSLALILENSKVKHLSAYELTINENTPFGRHRKFLPLPEEKVLIEMHSLVSNVCNDFNFQQYEISNYSLSGYQSCHNLAYWDHKPYIGLGCSAHSYIHPNRWANIEDITGYLNSIDSGKPAIEYQEEICKKELSTELIYLGLRKNIGLDEKRYLELTGQDFYNDVRKAKLEKFVSDGLLIYSLNRYWCLTDKGRIVSNRVVGELI